MNNDFLVFDHVTKRFGALTAVNDVSFSVSKGEFFSLLGPSGCGKTTLLRMLGGFERPDSGRIYLEGKDITDLPPNQRRVHTVFQNYALFPHMNVEKNIAYGLRVLDILRTVDLHFDHIAVLVLALQQLNEHIRARDHSDKAVVFVQYGIAVEFKLSLRLFSSQEADVVILMKTYGRSDKSVKVIFYFRNLLRLLVIFKIFVNDADTSLTSQCNSHRGLRNGIHRC